MNTRHYLKKTGAWTLTAVLCLTALCGCDMMSESYDDCPTGLYLAMKYDYNLERADLLKGHIGSVTVYVYSPDDELVATYDQRVEELTLPFVGSEYWTLHITDLPEGSYKFTVLAQQAPYSETMASNRAHFERQNVSSGDAQESLVVKLDKQLSPDGTYYRVENHDLPLDTLWHGIETDLIEVWNEKPTYDTISLVRDTKNIHIALRELDDPTTMDINNFGMTISDHNSVILWDNELDESDLVVYTPYATWNTDDITDAVDSEGNPLGEPGHIGHADLMTSRLIYHSGTRADGSAADDGVLSVTNLETGEEVAAFNLPSVLAQLRNSDDLHRYQEQEFLDRGYDYTITIFLRGGKLSYITIEIDILGWSKRIQYEEL